MSLPATGRFEAQLLSWKLVFDGQRWTGEGKDFGQLVGPALARETPRHQGTHRTVDVIGRSVLERLFPGRWTEISAKVDVWKEALEAKGED